MKTDISVNLHIYVHGDSGIAETAREILAGISGLSRKVDSLMKSVHDFALELDAATNLIAQRIQVLIDKVNAGTFTEADAAELETIKARMVELGKDPQNPVPAAKK